MPSQPRTFKPPRAKAPKYRPKEADRQRTRALNTGSKAWRMIRQQVLIRDGHRCRACGRLVAGNEAHVDHKGNDASSADSNRLDNLQCLCIQCHGSKSLCERGGKDWKGRRPRIGLDGWPEVK